MNADLARSGKNPILLAAALSIPAILEQLLVTATSYVDTTMVVPEPSGHCRLSALHLRKMNSG